jgi:lysophospholipase L1-like esterase
MASRLIRLTVLLAAVIWACPPGWSAEEKKDAPKADKWESTIQKFEENDKKTPPPPNPILLVGSSTFAMWGAKAVEALKPLPVINRGFGGSTLADVLRYLDRVVIAYRPRVVVLYEGDNDLWGGKKPPAYLEEMKTFVERIRQELPKARLFICSIKPSPSRAKIWSQVQEANRLVAEFCKTQQGVEYVDTATPMLDAEGKAREELFIKDKLHMNADGYRIWTDILKPLLEKADKETAGDAKP